MGQWAVYNEDTEAAPMEQAVNEFDLGSVVLKEDPLGKPEDLSWGWWRASDGNWYPPELHPEYVPFIPKVRNESRETYPRHTPEMVINGTHFVGQKTMAIPGVSPLQVQEYRYTPQVSALGRWGIYESSYLLIGLGGILMAVSPFLPWFNISNVARISLNNILGLTASYEWLAQWVMVASGVILVACSITARKSALVAWLSVVFGFVMFGNATYGSWFYYTNSHTAHGVLTMGSGFILATAGVCMMLVGALSIKRKRYRLDNAYRRDVLKRHLMDI